jgi:hypothetical protein
VKFSGPECFSEPGLFEDYSEGHPAAIALVMRRLDKWSMGEDYMVNDGVSNANHETESPDTAPTL